MPVRAGAEVGGDGDGACGAGEGGADKAHALGVEADVGGGLVDAQLDVDGAGVVDSCIKGIVVVKAV